MASAVGLTVLDAIQLGAVEIRPGTREVVGPAGQEVIEPKVMQVLVALVAAKGEIVTRDQLVRDCWDGRAVSEDAISRVIQRLRRLSESLAAGSFVIKTVHKVGYRLLASDNDVREISTPESVAEEPAGIPRRGVLALAAAALTVGAGGFWLFRKDTSARQVDALVAQSEQALRAGMPESDGRAAGFLEQAAKLEPGNAKAWGRLALARTYATDYAPPDRTAAAVTGVQDAARRALQIDRRQVDALSALAILPGYYGDWFAAEKRMDAVLALDSGHLPTRDARDFMLSAAGRGREGSLDRIKMAAEDRLHATYQFKLIFAHLTLGQVNDADRAADRALQLWPKHPGVWFARYYTLALTGRAERALSHVNDAEARPSLPPPLIETLQATSIALASRRSLDIETASARLVAGVTLNPSMSVLAVSLLCGLNEIDRAFEVADAYLLEHGPLMASVRWKRDQNSISDERRRKTNMLFLPSSAPMQADPRFAVLMERTGFTDYWRRAGVTPDHLV